MRSLITALTYYFVAVFGTIQAQQVVTIEREPAANLISKIKDYVGAINSAKALDLVRLDTNTSSFSTAYYDDKCYWFVFNDSPQVWDDSCESFGFYVSEIPCAGDTYELPYYWLEMQVATGENCGPEPWMASGQKLWSSKEDVPGGGDTDPAILLAKLEEYLSIFEDCSSWR